MIYDSDINRTRQVDLEKVDRHQVDRENWDGTGRWLLYVDGRLVAACKSLETLRAATIIMGVNEDIDLSRKG